MKQFILYCLILLGVTAQAQVNAPKIPTVNIQRLRTDAVTFSVRFQQDAANLNVVSQTFWCEITEVNSSFLRVALTENAGITQTDSATLTVSLTSNQVKLLSGENYRYRLYTVSAGEQTTKLTGNFSLVSSVTASSASIIPPTIIINYTSAGVTSAGGLIVPTLTSGNGITITGDGYYTVSVNYTTLDVRYVTKVTGKGLSQEDYTTTEKSKLSGIATGATANSTDAQLRDRTTHTGVQAIGTVTGLQTALDAKATVVDNAAKSDSAHVHRTTMLVENRSALRDFFKAMYGWLTSPVGKLIGIGWYGDSVSPDIAAEYIQGLGASYPLSTIAFPQGLNSSMNYASTGTIIYRLPGRVEQTVNNGIINATITRSGSTATLTTLTPHGLSVGKYITISGANEADYNGVFQVASVPTTTTATYVVANSPATPATGTISLYGGVADFTYVPGGDHVELADLATVTVDAGQSTGFTSYQVFLATGPGMGSATLELRNNDTDALISSTTINLTGGSLNATKHTFTADPAIKHKVKIIASGKVVILKVYPLRDNGIIPVMLSCGGSTFSQQQFSNDAILQYLATNLNLSLLFVQAKEEGASDVFSPLAARLSSLTTTSKFIVGSLPDVTDEALQITKNSYFRSMALTKGWAYFDARQAIGGYSELVRLSWQGDGTHVNDGAKRLAASLIAGELNSLFDERTSVERRNIDQRGTSSTITGGTFKQINIIGSVDESQVVSVLVKASGADPGKVVIQNVRKLWLGNPATSSPGFENHGTFGVNTIDQSGALALHRMKNIEATATTGFSTFSHALRSGTGTGLALDALGDIALTGKLTPATSGAAQRAGTATLVAGTITVTTTAPVTNSLIFTQRKTVGGTIGVDIVYAQTNGASVTFRAVDSAGNTVTTDTSTFNWWIVN